MRLSLLQRIPRCETREGKNIIWQAVALSRQPEYADFTDDMLIRLAYWGASGTDTRKKPS